MDVHHDRIVDHDADESAGIVRPADFGDDWVHELIAMTRPGVEINYPFRGLGDRVIPFEYEDFD